MFILVVLLIIASELDKRFNISEFFWGYLVNPSILKINVINERILQNEMETISNHNISS